MNKKIINNSTKKGFSFGLTSGIITTLGLIVGLHSGTHSKSVIIGGICVIAIADSLSDALGIHISEESENKCSTKEVWQATFSTFLSKFIFAISFIVPILLFNLTTAIAISIIWGLSLIGIFSYYMAKFKGSKPSHIITEHVLISGIVIITTHFVGDFVATLG